MKPVTRTNHPNHHRGNQDRCRLHRSRHPLQQDEHLTSPIVQAMLYLWKSSWTLCWIPHSHWFQSHRTLLAPRYGREPPISKIKQFSQIVMAKKWQNERAGGTSSSSKAGWSMLTIQLSNNLSKKTLSKDIDSSVILFSCLSRSLRRKL